MQRAEGGFPGARALAAAFVVLFIAVRPGYCRAQSVEPVLLEWNAPSGCSSAGEVLARIRKLANARDVVARQLQAEATVVRAEGGQLHLKLALRADGLLGERNISGRTCEDLARATAVVLAVLLRSAAPLRGGDLDGGEQSEGESRARGGYEGGSKGDIERAAAAASAPASTGDGSDSQPRPEPGVAVSKPVRPSRRFRAVFQAPMVALGVGPLPRPSLGSALAGGVRFAHWSVLAEGAAWLKQTLRSRDQVDAGATVRHIEAAARGCRIIAWGRFELAPCLRLSLQHVWTRGTGVHVAAHTAQATWFAAGLGLQARYEMAHWIRAFVGVDAQIESSRPTISIDGVGGLGQLRPAAATFTVGSEWIL